MFYKKKKCLSSSSPIQELGTTKNAEEEVDDLHDMNPAYPSSNPEYPETRKNINLY